MPDQPLDLGGVQVRVDAWVTPPPPTDEHAISVYGPVGNVAQYTHEQWDNLTAAPADRAALLAVVDEMRRGIRVMCNSPMTESYQEGRRLLDLVRDA